MFKLVSKFEPSGDQPEAIKELVDGIKEGKNMSEINASYNDNDYMREIIEDLIFKKGQIIQIQKIENKENKQEVIVLLQKINDVIIEIIQFLQECQNQGLTIDCSILNKIIFKPLTIEYLEKMMEEYHDIATATKEIKKEFCTIRGPKVTAEELYIKRQYFVNKLPETLMPHINKLFPYYAYCFLEFISDAHVIYINHKIDLETFNGAKKIWINDKIEIERTDALAFSLPPAFNPLTENPKIKTVIINGVRARAYIDTDNLETLFCFVTPIEYSRAVVDERKLSTWDIVSRDKKYGVLGYRNDTGIVIAIEAERPIQGKVNYNISALPKIVWEKLSKQFYTEHKEKIRYLCKKDLSSENLKNILMQYINALGTMQDQINKLPKKEKITSRY